ncbi:MAG: hypothetical protein D6753_05190 [Planctomycetota bacterium]|nr:MAG: hypothetical protein D6753_05190 [Planctomycetota bacterium]
MHRFRPSLEPLEQRRVLASIAGTVSIDLDGNHHRDDTDAPVVGALVWVDQNRNGRFDVGEPSDYSDRNGDYLLNDIAPGEAWVRAAMPVGLIQTFPYEHVAMQYDSATDNFRLARIDSVTGEVTGLGDAGGSNRFGLIKTVDGEYYATDFRDDTLHKIDPLTGQQTLIGTFDQQVVAGLAYDPLMDEIYTLARPNDDGDPVAALRLFKVDRTSAALTPVSDIQPSIDGIEFTTSMAFDWVNRQVVLFDNGTDTAYAYDLQGEIRQLGTFAPQDGFFNLVFDGFRFLAHRTVQGNSVLFEVDPVAGTLTQLVSLNAPLNVNSADRLATNEPQRVAVPDPQSETAAIDFLATKLVIDSAQLNVQSDQMHLVVPSMQLDTSSSLGDASTEARFCVAGASHVDLQLSDTSTRSMQVALGDDPDRLSLRQTAFADWPQLNIDLGPGHDGLLIDAAETLSLPGIANRLSGIDEIQLVGPQVTTIEIDESAVAAISDAQALTVRLGAEDHLQLGDGQWAARGIELRDNQRLHAIATDQVMLSVRNGTPWHNPLERFDVNSDGSITPLDALLIINMINRTSPSALDESVSEFLTAPYIDTNGDNALSPIDVLLVVNHLNRT